MSAATSESVTLASSDARAQAARRLALDHALAEVACLLAGRGVRVLLIKGPAIARWLYDDPHERPYGDIDLLVAPDRFEMAQRALIELGFESWEPGLRSCEFSDHEEVWVRGGRMAAKVELHQSVYLLPASPSLVWQRLSAGSSLMEVAGAQVEVPSPAASTLIVGLHAARHGPDWAQPLRDLKRALERVDVRTWQAAAELARELGGAPALAIGLRLDPVGCELAERLGLSADGASRSVRLRVSAAPTPPTALGVARLFATRGARARLELAARELVPSPAFMRVWYPLARRGRWGLAVGYVWRPLWLAARLPRGVWAWLHVARAASDRRSGH